MFSKINKIVLVFSVFLTGAFFIKEVAAWVDPVDGQNIFAPLNTSSVGQTKLGGLVLNVGNATYGLIVRYGFVGIGVEKPTAMLEVGGDIKGKNVFVDQGKVRAKELCFAKQDNSEECLSEWPIGGGGQTEPEGPDANGIYNSMYYISSGGPGAFGLGSLFGYPINSYRDLRRIYSNSTSANGAWPQLPPIFYGEIKYVGGEKYSRAVVGYNPTQFLCDSGYVKGTEASCNDSAGVYGVRTTWGSYTDSRGYVKVSNYIIGNPGAGSTLIDPWGARSSVNYGNEVYPLLPNQTLFGQNIYNRSNIDVLRWKYKPLKEVDLWHLPFSQFLTGSESGNSGDNRILAPSMGTPMPAWYL